MPRRHCAALLSLVAGTALLTPAAAGGADALRVAPIRDHFCTVAGSTCKRPEVAVDVTAPRGGVLIVVLRRRPLRRDRRGRFTAFGEVRLRVPAGASRRDFRRLAGGRLVGVGDYAARAHLRGSPGAAVRFVFFVRPS